MITTPFQTVKLVIQIAKMQHIFFFAHQLMMNFNLPIGNVYCRSVLSVIILLSQKLKEIHWTEHQWLCLTRIWLNLLVYVMASWYAKNYYLFRYKRNILKYLFLMWTFNPIQDSCFHTRMTVWESKTVFCSTQDGWFSKIVLYSTNWKISLSPQFLQNTWKTSYCLR